MLLSGKCASIVKCSLRCTSRYLVDCHSKQLLISGRRAVREYRKTTLVGAHKAFVKEWTSADDGRMEDVVRLEKSARCLTPYKKWEEDSSLLECCEVEKPLKVAMLLSGGVDSSVALALLRAAGHDIKAYYLKIWFQEDFENFWSSCPWEEDLLYAQQVCHKLNVDLKIVPMTHEYWERVAEKTIVEIKSGKTPNPDIWCNSRIKFGAFMEFLESHNVAFDRIATGHYAKLLRTMDESGEENLLLTLCKDKHKDQTYFLAQLNKKQLAKCLFPLGNLEKSEVRQLASVAGLSTVNRKDSQGICFLGKVKFSEFIERHLGKWPGLILEEDTHRQLGFHDGYWYHTIGQRSGLKMAGGPWYVTRKDILWNVLYVRRLDSVHSPKHTTPSLIDRFFCRQLSWFVQDMPDFAEMECKVRHGYYMYRGRVLEIERDGCWIGLDGTDQGLASGQYAVFYRNGVCLGSGVIESAAVMS